MNKEVVLTFWQYQRAATQTVWALATGRGLRNLIGQLLNRIQM
ncbi:hypothetical protein [Mariniblastus fucicola]|nr:hypothetical protein [Mariniblastus fucicola]